MEELKKSNKIKQLKRAEKEKINKVNKKILRKGKDIQGYTLYYQV